MSSALPSPTRLSTLRNTVQYLNDPLDFLVSNADPPVSRTRLSNQTYVIVTEPDLIYDITTKRPRAFPKPEFMQKQLYDILGEGLVMNTGDNWQQQRQRLQPAFFRGVLPSYLDTATAVTHDYLASAPTGGTVNLQAEMMRIAVRIISRAMLGTEITDDEADALYDAINVAGDHLTPSLVRAVLPDWVPTPHNLRYRRSTELIRTVTDDIVRKTDPEDAPVYLRLLLDADIDTEMVQDELVTILLAGHETTGATLTFTWYVLGHHPEVQEAVYEESRRVLGDLSDGFDRAMMDALDEMEYTEAVLKEVMRLYPPLYQLLRTAKEPSVVGGYDVPEGSFVSMPQYVVHRDERFFDDPDEFRPDRWLDGGSATDAPNMAYFPFGAGPRRCIGRDLAMALLKTVVGTVVQRREVQTPPGGLDLTATVTLRPAENVPARFAPRT